MVSLAGLGMSFKRKKSQIKANELTSIMISFIFEIPNIDFNLRFFSMFLKNIFLDDCMWS